MSFGKFFTQQKIPGRQLICEDQTVQTLIEEWTENENWSPHTFVSIMQKLGLKTPLRVKTTGRDAFTCVDGTGTQYHVALRFSDPIDFHSTIWLTKGKQTDSYIIRKGKNFGEAFRIEEGSTTTRQMRDKKLLESTYSIYHCEHTLTVGKEYLLAVQINEPNWINEAESKENRKVLQNREKVEEYLKTIQFPVNVKEVLGKILEMLGFTEQDIKNCDVAFVATQNRPGNENLHIRDFYLLERGKSKGYDHLVHWYRFPED